MSWEWKMYWNNIQSDTDISFWVANHCWPVWYLRCCPNLAAVCPGLHESCIHIHLRFFGGIFMSWCFASVIRDTTFFFFWLWILNHTTLYLHYQKCDVQYMGFRHASPGPCSVLSFSHPSPHCLFNHPSIKTLYQMPDCGDSRAADASVSQQLSPAYTGDALRQAGQCSPPGVLS